MQGSASRRNDPGPQKTDARAAAEPGASRALYTVLGPDSVGLSATHLSGVNSLLHTSGPQSVISQLDS